MVDENRRLVYGIVNDNLVLLPNCVTFAAIPRSATESPFTSVISHDDTAAG